MDFCIINDENNEHDDDENNDDDNDVNIFINVSDDNVADEEE